VSRFHAQLDRAFNARVVAVVGDKRHNAFIWLRGLRNFSRQLYSVQIEPKEVAAIEAMGVRNVRSLSEIPEPIDYAVLVVPRGAVPSALRDCARQQVGAVTVFTAGFSETGEAEGIRLEQEIVAIARQANLLVIGPNCMGVANPRLGLCNFPGEASGPEAAGPVAFMGQSGTHTITFCMRAPTEGVGISKAVSFGNALTADAADYLDYLRADGETSVICAYIEGVRDGRRFYDVLRQTTPTKPVILWKGGISAAGQRAIFSHTAALATPQAVWQGMVRQAGAISVESQDELLDVARTLLAGKSAHGWRAGLVAMTGGPSVVMTDVFTETGLEVPLLADASYAKLAQFFRVVGGGLGNPLDAGSTIAMGFDADKTQQDILGTEWINLLTVFDPAGGKSKLVPDKAAMAKEMKKIEGYPIVIDGKYFPAPKPKTAEDEDQGGGGGLLGKLGKSLLKKKPNPEEENAPAIAFYTEVMSIAAGALDAAAFQPPADYKKK